MHRVLPLSPSAVLWAYARGAFPMADSRDGQVNWYSPDPRAVLPLDRFKVSRSLRRRFKAGTFTLTRDRAFAKVIDACSQPRPYARDTWINDEIKDTYIALHEHGYAHSVEAWDRDEPSRLVGGLYGLSIGGAFFGESMFSRATDASKVCLVELVEHLNNRGYQLLDVQLNNAHMAQFGVIEIPREEYLRRLSIAIEMDVSW